MIHAALQRRLFHHHMLSLVFSKSKPATHSQVDGKSFWAFKHQSLEKAPLKPSQLEQTKSIDTTWCWSHSIGSPVGSPLLKISLLALRLLALLSEKCFPRESPGTGQIDCVERAISKSLICSMQCRRSKYPPLFCVLYGMATSVATSSNLPRVATSVQLKHAMHRHKSTSTPDFSVDTGSNKPYPKSNRKTIQNNTKLFTVSLKKILDDLLHMYIVCLCTFLSATYWPSAASFWPSKGPTDPTSSCALPGSFSQSLQLPRVSAQSSLVSCSHSDGSQTKLARCPIATLHQCSSNQCSSKHLETVIECVCFV
jgi:hypothetical protein